MKEKKRLTAFVMSLILLVTLIMPANTTRVYAEDNNKTNASQAVVANPNNVVIQVLATTDLHGKFKNYDYATTSVAAGGLNQVATVVKEEKAKNPNTIVVDQRW